MPIQIEENDFVQFVYDPDYLRPEKYRFLKSNTSDICAGINFSPRKSKLIVDGGNIIRYSDKVLMCDKVFKENPKISPADLTDELQMFQ